MSIGVTFLVTVKKRRNSLVLTVSISSSIFLISISCFAMLDSIFVILRGAFNIIFLSSSSFFLASRDRSTRGISIAFVLLLFVFVVPLLDPKSEAAFESNDDEVGTALFVPFRTIGSIGVEIVCMAAIFALAADVLVAEERSNERDISWKDVKNQLKKAGFVLFPNPASEQITLRMNFPVSGNTNVKIYNALGIEVYTNVLLSLERLITHRQQGVSLTTMDNIYTDDGSGNIIGNIVSELNWVSHFLKEKF